MLTFRDRAQAALQRAAEPTLERIRADRESAPEPLAKLLAYFEEHLFHPNLTVKSARSALGIRDNSFSVDFRRHCGMTPAKYIERLRIETAVACFTPASPRPPG